MQSLTNSFRDAQRILDLRLLNSKSASTTLRLIEVMRLGHAT